MSDDQVLEKSGLSQRGNMGLLKDVWIVGNSGYPLMDWVLVPYKFESEREFTLVESWHTHTMCKISSSRTGTIFFFNFKFFMNNKYL